MGRVTDPALLAQLETSQASINRGGKPSGGMMGGRAPTAMQAQALSMREGNLRGLAAKLADVEARYNRDLKGVGPASLLEYLPLPRNKACPISHSPRSVFPASALSPIASLPRSSLQISPAPATPTNRSRRSCPTSAIALRPRA
jgi:hypothetical protein